MASEYIRLGRCYPIDIVPHDSETLIAQGYCARREGRSLDARKLFSQAVQLSRSSGDQHRLASSLTGLGQIERDLNNRDLNNSHIALGHYQEAAEIYRALNNPLRLAHTLRHIGDILRKEGRFDDARPCYREALEIYRHYPETQPLDLANALRGFALLLEKTGEREHAQAHWREAGSLYASVNVQAGVLESEAQIALLG